MYERGLLQSGREIDTREDYVTVEGVFLPHSCQEWVIGGPAQVEALIEDLNAWLQGSYKQLLDENGETLLEGLSGA